MTLFCEKIPFTFLSGFQRFLFLLGHFCPEMIFFKTVFAKNWTILCKTVIHQKMKWIVIMTLFCEKLPFTSLSGFQRFLFFIGPFCPEMIFFKTVFAKNWTILWKTVI